MFFSTAPAPRQLGLQSPALALVQLVGLESEAVRLYACKVKNPGEFHDAMIYHEKNNGYIMIAGESIANSGNVSTCTKTINRCATWNHDFKWF